MLKCRYTRAEQAEAARRGLIGLELPIPDARFEQGYLMSIRRESRRLMCRIDLPDVGAVIAAFIRTTSTPVPRRPKGDSTPRRESVTRDKRRRLEESLALVEDPASRTGSGINDIFSSNPRKAHQQVTIDWKSIFHVTLRDHLFWPLISGVAWTFGGLLWGGFASYRAAKQAAAKQWEPSSWSENSGNTMWSYVITPWSRLMERYEN